jgi:predicted PurR-regulated permease PerM
VQTVWWPRTWTERAALLFCAGVLLYVTTTVLMTFASVLTPVLTGFVVAYFLAPVIDWLEQRRVGRALAIAVVGLGALGALVGVLWIFVAAIVPELAAAIPRLVQQLMALLEDPGQTMADWSERPWLRWAAPWLERSDLSDQLQAGLRTLVEGVGRAGLTALQALAASIQTSATAILNLVLIPIFTFYFLMDFRGFCRWPLGLVPPRFREGIASRAVRMDAAVGQWVRGQLQVAAILGVLFGLGLWLFGIRMGWAIGLVAGLLNVVPYLGGISGFALALTMALISDHPIWQSVGVAVVFTVVQTLESYLITPRLVGDAVGMSPLVVMVVLLVAGTLFGFFGLLLGIPAVAAGTVLVREGLDIYRASRFYAGMKPPPAEDDRDGDTPAGP